MNILLVFHRIPYPLRSGYDKVVYNLIRTLSLAHRVTLLAPMDENTGREAVAHMRSLCHELVTVPVKNRTAHIQRSKWLYTWRLLRLCLFRVPMYITNEEYPEVTGCLRQLCASQPYDIIQGISIRTASSLQTVPHSFFRVSGPFDDSVESARSELQVAPNWRKRWIFRMECRARSYYQPRASSTSDRVFFFSQDDLRRISDLAGGLPQARVLPVAVEGDDARRAANGFEEPDSLVFIGGLASLFNQDAVQYFYREIYPLILKEVPRTRFYIVGQSPPQEIMNLGEPGKVIVTGSVPDVRPYIEQAAVYVAPIRAGTGIKTKMIEALSLGKAIVATRPALQGLWDVDETVIQIRDHPEDFARTVVELLGNKALRMELGHKARDLYERSYTFDKTAPKTLEVYSEIEEIIRKRKRN